MTTPEHRRRLSHVLRRLQFGVWPGQIESLEELELGQAVAQLITEDTPYIPDDGEVAAFVQDLENGDWDSLTKWYMGRITDRGAGLHERMVWFWHGHLTSSTERAKPSQMFRQNVLFRRHALGNFRDLLKAATVDAAMLNWLDGNGSRGEAPNENYAREMMELFALGAGEAAAPNYTEDDIRAAARALSGWYVDYETDEVSFEPEEHYDRPIRFLGERRRWDADTLVDKICDQPACARHVAAALHRHFIGTEPTEAELDELATKFRGENLELQPLVQAIVAQPSFTAGIPARARTAVEWMAATMATLGPANVELEHWWLEMMGQVPFAPPNVAGWSADNRWVGASQQLARTSILMDLELSAQIINSVEPTADAVLAHCGLHDVSATTREALEHAIDAQTEFDYGLELLMTLALTSPEFALV